MFVPTSWASRYGVRQRIRAWQLALLVAGDVLLIVSIVASSEAVLFKVVIAGANVAALAVVGYVISLLPKDAETERD